MFTGDLDDSDSNISHLVAREKVSVHKPEQGTAPKLFYIDGDEVTLTPTAAHLSTLLVIDLDKPARFFTILTRPQ